ncbi:MAG: ATP-dependent helicase [Chitinivibrionales bacterium]
MSMFIDGLNDRQKEAVLHNDGPLLVLAGAGSGKTRVLTHRIARLVSQKLCRPEQILAVTFTNKAAREMQIRVASLVSRKAAEAMTICTFHSLGVRILREDGEAIGLRKNFSILDDHQRLATLKEIVRSTSRKKNNSKDHEELGTKISLAKNASMEPDQFAKDPESRAMYRTYKAYRARLLKRQSVDFDDLLLLPLQLFEQHPEILKKYQQRYTFISVDEFQDTNGVQMKLARMLATPKNNLMVVGDDDQGIYSWRGAEIENIIYFSQKFKGCKTVVLDKNYRSTEQILEGAHAVVEKNRKRRKKHITAVAGPGEPIVCYRADDEIEEAEWIARTIKYNVERSLFSYTEHALLFRTNAMMRRFEEEFRRQQIPYFVQGAMSFFDRKEIKDVLAYLRFFANTEDELSLMRVLKVPNKGFTPSVIEKLEDMAGFRRIPLWEAIERHEMVEQLSDAQHRDISSFVDFYKRHSVGFARGELAKTARSVLTESGYLELLKHAHKDDETAEQRIENINEILHGMEIYESKFRKNKPHLDGYIQELTLVVNDNPDDESQKTKRGVIMMTLHKSKGLEFPVVFLANLDDSVMPSPRTIREGNIDEERRLFYVGMTRAQKVLYLTYPHTKVFRKKTINVTPTRFIREIPEKFLDAKLGEKEEAEFQSFADDFFSQMRAKFGSDDEEEIAGCG